LLAITLAGALLRLYKLGEWSFWGDEAFTFSGQEDGFNYSPIRQSLSLILIQSVTATNGLNEWNARIVPAIIGILTIPVIYFIAKKIFDTGTALLAALLLALSPWHLYWSQNARFYTPLLLFYFLSLFFFYLGLEGDKPWYLILCLFFLGLAVKERLLALFFLPVVLVYVIFIYVFSYEQPKGWRFRNVAIFLLPGLLGGIFFTRPYLLDLPGWFSGFGFANNSPLWLAGGFVFYVGLPVICLGSLGGIYLVMRKNRAGLLLSVSAIVPLLLLMAVSTFHYTANRYAFISLASWLILAAVSLTTLIRRTFGSARMLAFGALLILVISPLGEDALYYQYQNGNRENWKAAFAYIREHRQPGDLVASDKPAIADYYLGTPSIAYDRENFDETEVQGQRIWFVEDIASIGRFPELHTWISENAQLVSVHDVYFQARNFTIRVYLHEPNFRTNTGLLENER
jgi:hypothetical protein